jgi:type III pantothenate kinase
MSINVLAIDAGNTRIKWGLHDGRGWVSRDAIATVDFAGSQIFNNALNAAAIDCVAISNVAGSAVASELGNQLHFLAKPVTFITATANQCGVVNGYEVHAQLGSDRWAALIAAHAAAKQMPHPQLVVMSGTALTVDALTADGKFLGGIIVPGLLLMHRALTLGTAQLPSLQGEHQAFPCNTPNAITSGALEACAGAVQRMYSHLAEKVGDVPRCIGSGGAIEVLAAHLPFPVSINDNLVLDGLVDIANSP